MRFSQKNLEQPGALDTTFFARFAREEDGSLTIFSMFLMLAMLVTTGLAVDVMRFENQDTLLRNTADSAVLACADMQQEQEPTQVVKDFFETRGLSHVIKPGGIVVEEGLNFRRCDVEVAANMQTMFIDADIFSNDGYDGVEYLSSGKESAAEERITDIEISLVLDVSGSMGGSKIRKLHSAGKDFVDDVIKPEYQGVSGTTSISVIPYNGKVNAGKNLADAFGVAQQYSDGTSASHCVRFKPEHFQYTNFPTGTVRRIAHYDADTNNYTDRNNNEERILRPHCQTNPNDRNKIMVHEIDPEVLKTKIGRLTAGGWTATDVGTKWGTILLDPTSQGNIAPLVDASVNTRPEQFLDPETMKVMVIMTDGDNTRQYDLKDEFKTGMSHVYYSANRDRYIVNLDWRNSGERQWYLPHNNQERWNVPSNMSDIVQVSWPDLMQRYNLEYISEYFYDNYNTWENRVRWAEDEFTNDTSGAGNALADSNLLAICEKARDQQVLIYTIAFSAPTHAQNILTQCAGASGNAFNVGSNELDDAFDSIASKINHLKLIQ
ncbi:MAG: Tad domain-containing protein [Pseudomonadota bacterium]